MPMSVQVYFFGGCILGEDLLGFSVGLDAEARFLRCDAGTIAPTSISSSDILEMPDRPSHMDFAPIRVDFIF